MPVAGGLNRHPQFEAPFAQMPRRLGRRPPRAPWLGRVPGE
jgi:hypothetical protein